MDIYGVLTILLIIFLIEYHEADIINRISPDDTIRSIATVSNSSFYNIVIFLDETLSTTLFVS